VGLDRDQEYEIVVPHFYEEMAADELEFEDIQRAIFTGRIRRKFTDEPRGTRYEASVRAEMLVRWR
jgi:hypothetical protein